MTREAIISRRALCGFIYFDAGAFSISLLRFSRMNTKTVEKSRDSRPAVAPTLACVASYKAVFEIKSRTKYTETTPAVVYRPGL